MIIINGSTALTINAVSDTYKIEYETRKSVDIYNGTNTEIYVNSIGDFSSGEYFVIPPGGGYNDYRFGAVDGASLYVKSQSEGKISIVCRRY